MEIPLKNAVATGLLAGLLLSYALWISSRSYPLTPVARFLKPIPFPFDYAVFLVLLVLLYLIIVVSRPTRLITAFVCLAAVWALFDQSRWQPWFYQYLFMLTALGLSFANSGDEGKRKSALDACRLVVVSIYFWSGIQKLNLGFVQKMFPWLLEPLVRFLPATVKGWLHPFWFIAPLVEMGIGVGLLTKRFRNSAVIVAVIMHLFILASIGPLGHNFNNVVWPWNVAMSAFVVLLFWRAEEIPLRNILWGNRFAFQKLVLVLFGIAPVLGIFNLWDGYLSFALYSGNRNTATIYVPASVVDRLPDDVQDLVTEEDSTLDKLDVDDWSLAMFNAPSYPEIRIFKSAGAAICRETANPPGVKLVVQRKALWSQPKRQLVYDCASLSK